MAKITIQNLSKQYKRGEIQALDNISLEIEDGSFFCLLGPAGAGKTTTIKLIAGIEATDSGEILLDDAPVTDMMPRDRNVAVAFETYALYPQLTVRENLAFPLRAPVRKDRWTEETIEQRVVELANLLGIGELLDRLPRQLSGGQRQRVALGRALVRKPRAYLLDEPIAHLDAKLRHRMRGELKRIQIELGITTVYTTPDQLDALSLADRMAVINQGRIEQIGTPEEVYKRPANVFVARFVGEPPMNIFNASIEGEELLVNNAIRLPLGAEQRSLLDRQSNGRQVKLGVRPKDISVVDEGSGDAQARSGVEHVQVLGETAVLTLSMDTLELHAKLATSKAPSRGSHVGLAFDPASFYFFNAETERLIEEQ